MPGDEDDPIAEDSAGTVAEPGAAPSSSTSGPAGGGEGKPKLTKEQISAISADIAAVTKTMQEQLAAISQEVNALKGQLHGGAGGIGDIQKELDSLRSQASVLDGATKTGQRLGGGARQRQLGSTRSAVADDGRYGSGDRYSSFAGATSRKASWSDEDRRSLDASLQRQMRDQGKRERGTPWRTVLTVTLAFLVIGPFRQLLIQLVKDVLGGNTESVDGASGDDGFEF